MNRRLIACFSAVLLALFGPGRSYSQGTFQNLNFESARIILDQSSPYYPYAVNATNALPGWTVRGGVAYPDVLYNDIALGAPAISIHDTNDRGQPAIEGNYSVYLQAFGSGINIAQTGQIPAAAQSLLFWSYSYNTALQVSFAGQPIPYSSIGSGPNYTIYGGNIGTFAGQTGELRFGGSGFLDNIQFSSLPTPEPGAFSLCALGALLCGWRAARRRQ
jgi:hypothetical protein